MVLMFLPRQRVPPGDGSVAYVRALLSGVRAGMRAGMRGPAEYVLGESGKGTGRDRERTFSPVR
jgi:hypothetical protein